MRRSLPFLLPALLAAATASEAPGSLEMLFRLASGYEQEGRTEEETAANRAEALSVYRKILDAGPAERERCEAWWGIARLEAKRGRLWPAFEALEKSFPPQLEAEPVRVRVDLQFLLGEKLSAAGAKPAAGATEKGRALSGHEAGARIFHAVVYNDPRHGKAAEALLREADCLLATGDAEKAEPVYRRLLREWPRSAFARAGMAGLAEALFTRPHPKGLPPEVVEEGRILLRDSEASGEVDADLRRRLEAAAAGLGEASAADLLFKGDQYARQKNEKNRSAAVFSYRETIRQYPGTRAAREASERLRGLGVPMEEPHTP